MSVKRKLHKLNSEFERDFVLIGIASHENDYRLSWSLNKELGFSFTKVDDLVAYNNKHSLEIAYSKYINSSEDCSCSLISNKSEQGFLLQKLKNIDFILKIPIDSGIDFINETILRLKKIDIIITAFMLENITERQEKLFEF